MPSLEHFIVAHGVAVDQVTNEISVFRFIESFRPGGLPFAFQDICVVSVWQLRPEDIDEDFQVALRLIEPNGTIQNLTPSNFTPTSPRQRIITRFPGMRFNDPGEYAFEIRLNGALVATRGITVEPPDAPPSDETGP